MPIVITALGVGGATIIGSLLGFIIKKPSHKLNDIILSFAAGVMLAAAVVGLIIPSINVDNKLSIIVTIVGIVLGALSLNLIDKIVPHLHRIVGADIENHPENSNRLNKVLLFVIAIAIHNLPEGIAAGVSFGSGDFGRAISVTLGIALQNIPEGMIIIAPLLASGLSKKKTFLIASITGVVEVLGTFIGYFAVNISSIILPFALAFAGGTMLYVISDEMIPETHAHGNERAATYALIIGFVVMLLIDFLIG